MGRAESGEKPSDEDGGSRSNLKAVSTPESADNGVRAICPFCGASNPTPEYFCCADWFAMMYPASDTEEAALQQKPAWLTLPNLATVQARLRAGSQLLVTLLASAIVAVLASLATQSRSVDSSSTVAMAPHPSNVTAANVGGPLEPPAIPAPAPAADLAALPASAEPQPAVAAAPPAIAAPAAVVEAPPAVAAAAPGAAPSEPVASVPAPAPQPVAVASVKGEAMPQTPAPLIAPAPASRHAATAHAPAPRKLALAERAPAIAVMPQPPPAVSPEAEAVPVVALPPDGEVARRAAQEAAATWREPGQTVRLPETASDSSHWHSLRHGMNRDSVRRLLGEPKWKRHVVGAEFWLYEENSLYSDGWVSFADPGEELMGWRGSSSTR
jgi:hypothetical protein